MFKVHTKDGLTKRLDISDEQDEKDLSDLISNQTFQKKITGVSVVQHCSGHFRCPVCKKSGDLVCSVCGQPSQTITCNTGIQYSLSKPIGFDDVFYNVERIEPNGKIKGGERVTVFVGDLRITLMVHASQLAAKISLARVGKQRYNPITDRE